MVAGPERRVPNPATALSEALGARLARDLNDLPQAISYVAAFSGGLDSQVLLHALARLRPWGDAARLKALHIHHGLNPRADDWAQFCAQQCHLLGIELQVVRVRVDHDSGEGLEAAARRARYEAFEAALDENSVLLLAHHQDDQAETLLLNLLRGSGVKGLAAMPRQRRLGRGKLARPLLDWTRAELEAVARAWQLDWVEDDSNESRVFDRNFLRHEILPRLRSRWPAATARLAQSARWCGEADQLLDEWASQDLQGMITADGSLRLEPFQALPRPRQRNLLRHWLAQAGRGLPGERTFERILDEVVQARPDATPEVRWPGACLRRYRNCLVLLEESGQDSATVAKDLGTRSAELDWDLASTLELPLGRLAALPVREGVRLRMPKPGERVSVRFRQGGERVRPAPSGRLRPLKKLLQEWGVPPWLRARLPLVYFDDELVAIPGYLVARDQVAVSDEPGIQLVWMRDD